jgi:hypothetical protein
MAISEHESGSQTTSGTTEHTLNTTTPNTTDGVFQFVMDVSDMASTEEIEIRIKEKCRTGDTQRQIHMWKLKHVAIDPLWVSPSLILLHGWDFSVKATVGASIVLPWSIRKIA